MMKKLMKLSIVLLVVLLCFNFVASNVCSATWKADIGQFDDQNNGTLDSKTKKIVGAIVSVTRIIATGIAIIMLAAVAMKYMSSAPGDRAEIKKHAVIYVVGAIVLFGGAGLLKIIQDFSQSI